MKSWITSAAASAPRRFRSIRSVRPRLRPIPAADPSSQSLAPATPSATSTRGRHLHCRFCKNRRRGSVGRPPFYIPRSEFLAVGKPAGRRHIEVYIDLFDFRVSVVTVRAELPSNPRLFVTAPRRLVIGWVV